MQGLYIYYIKFIYKVHNGTKARKKVGQNKPGLVRIHGICEGAGTNKAACGVYAISVSFSGSSLSCSGSFEGLGSVCGVQRRLRVVFGIEEAMWGNMLPPCRFRGSLWEWGGCWRWCVPHTLPLCHCRGPSQAWEGA